MDYARFFHSVTGCDPFPYQLQLGEGLWPNLLEVPTGLGKTAAVVVAWMWKVLNEDKQTPLRMAYCLPMRVLVEQTMDCGAKWVENAAPEFHRRGRVLPGVYLLMGGETEAKWVERPEEPSLIVGTQDMLLSRALMRGYGMSRYQWSIHFALLHNDALWVFDEIQLMGAGLPTTAQLEAFRRRLPLARPSRSIWMSATLNSEWLGTVDLQPHLATLQHLGLEQEETAGPTVKRRREAVKRLHQASTKVTTENQKQSAKNYAEALASEVAEKHVDGSTTLVIVNTVERCQAILEALNRRKISAETFLVHSRYRPAERLTVNRKLTESPASDGPGRIIIATQAVEAGVDITSRVLFTELAPWASLVQRFGRCNRYGELGEIGADIFWIDIEQGGKLDAPYEVASLDLARSKLADLPGASPADLPGIDEEAPLHPVIRYKDFRDLFNTDPDLTGFDVDISPYIRDADDLDVQVSWRDLSQGTEDQPLPQRTELCRASLSQAKVLFDRIRKQELWAYRWDSLDGKWRMFQTELFPGLVLMLDMKAGGYSGQLGFHPPSKDPVVPVDDGYASGETEIYEGDIRSHMAGDVTLTHHLSDAGAAAEHLLIAVKAGARECNAVRMAASWHDVGKSHRIFQATMHGCTLDEALSKGPLLAKSTLAGRHKRRHFRHELASMLAWVAHRSQEEESDLIAYLIAAHHGKVRLSLRSLPEENEPTPPFGPRFARGVWENETLPPVDGAKGEVIPTTLLRLDLMELGEGPMGPSWTTRTQRLLERYGPFQLAWLEAMVRIADWRASASETEEHA
ncbi:CRISPR-associated endonuclease Cas3'' [Desulforhabdus sp. TSK]|uniref:type I-G CRISPR-associated helicase/endonuclease Cas3g n=1 Tax=Desulforhabdus sp. TSK TaxID=2925014 RepID=UPI001FC7FCA3|nr:CRISPR-associated endonuclease Cas3'' [Desulforhabdus sp. TSK]GKT07593.1 hypothetical protein DSTSK_08980 [Desulforhabdus sp. TSK]